MGDIGAEVGLKMRSAIKAKLMELDCYVDDELPDYIMVMVANKRTKSQMKEDLTLFLNAKTTSFVDWLHIVLKKLKEVHVTNPDILKRSSKRKSNDTSEAAKKIKKEKKGSKSSKNSKKVAEFAEPAAEEISLTDDLPITANKLTEVRKIVVMQNNATSNATVNKSDTINEDMFDIPLLSEVDNLSNEEELRMIERRINSVKSRLGIQVQSSSESDEEDKNKSEDEDFINLKADPEDVISGDVSTSSLTTVSSQRKGTIIQSAATSSGTNIRISEDKSHTPPPPHKAANSNNYTSQNNAAIHARIVFEEENIKKNSYLSRQVTVGDDLPTRKRSILDRLGKRAAMYDDMQSRLSKVHKSNDRFREEDLSRKRHKEKEDRGNEDRRRESNRRESRSRISDHDKNKEDISHRTGVKSKVSIPDLPPKPQVVIDEESDSELEKKVKKKGVASVIKLKPRVLPPASRQANKNLLLKAVAEAQRSIAQTPAVGSTKRDAMFTKGYKDKVFDQAKARKISIKEKSVLRNMLKAIVNSPMRKVTLEEDDLEYVPKPIKEQHGTVNIQYKPSPLKQLSVTSETSSDADLPTLSKPLDINFKQQFIVTLDGVDEQQFSQPKNDSSKEDVPKRISPIIFNKMENKNGPSIKDRSKIPDQLPLVTVPGLKSRERCKFWPNCKAGDNCEFHHPVITPSAPDGNCKMFPNCKFGDKCLYVHPTCKFENSCTRRDCAYSHKSAVSRIVSTPSVCKYHPKCNNIHCSFYHPLTKPCKFGKYCKNQPECIFSHTSTTIVPKPASLTWRSNT